jgi:hypothetical protein
MNDGSDDDDDVRDSEGTTASALHADQLWQLEPANDAALCRVRAKLMADFTSPSPYVRTQQLLTCLQESFNANDRCPSDYGIPLPDAVATSSVEREVHRWLRDPELEAFVNDRPLLGEQLEVSRAVDECFASRVERSTFGMLFIDRPPGTGKTTTVKHVLSRGRLDGKLSLVCAPTNLAALLYETGVSAHSLFELTVQRFPDEPVQSRISSPMASKAQLIKHAKIIVIDEISSLLRSCWEAILNVLVDFGFTGNVVLMCLLLLHERFRIMRLITWPTSCLGLLLVSGDFRQIGPVLPGASSAQQINASPRSSPSWRFVRSITLTTNRRLEVNCPEWEAQVYALGNGTAPTVGTNSDGRALVDISYIETRFDTTEDDAAIDFVYGGATSGTRAILSPHDARVRYWNEHVQSALPGVARTYLGHTSVEHESLSSNAALESFGDGLDVLTANNAPDHRLTLKGGDWVILTRTIDKHRRLVANQRVQIRRMWDHIIAVSLPDETNGRPGQITNVPRWRNLFNLGTSEIQIARIQFPFRLAYVMLFNKAQGQTFDAVLIDFTTGGAFAHGHLYVAMSRVRNPLACAAYVCAVDTSQTQNDADFGSACTKQNMVTPHIVHTQLLRTDDDNAADTYAVSPSDQTSQLLSIRSLLDRHRAAQHRRRGYCGPITALRTDDNHSATSSYAHYQNTEDA